MNFSRTFFTLASLGALCSYVRGARADWIEPPTRRWKIEARLSSPYAEFSMRNREVPAGLNADLAKVTYRTTLSFVPAIVFGYRFINISFSKHLTWNDDTSDFTSFRLGFNFKYLVADFALQRTKGLRTTTTAGTLFRRDVSYTMAGFNGFGGISFTGDVPYSVQTYYGSVEVPDGIEVDVDGFANLNWNSLGADHAIVPVENMPAFGTAADLKGFRSLALNAGVGLGVTFPLGGRWLASSMALAGISFLGGAQVYESDKAYKGEIGNQLGLRLAVLYRRDNHTWSLKGNWDRWTQSIRTVAFRQDFRGASISYAYRF